METGNCKHSDISGQSERLFITFTIDLAMGFWNFFL